MRIFSGHNRELFNAGVAKRWHLYWAKLTALVACGACLGFAGTAFGQAKPAPPREWTSPPTGDLQRGAALYQERCTACHNIDSNKIGPAHRGVMGRRIGSLPGYKYSDEMARSRLRWTPQTLNAWLEDPEELVAGQRMGFQVENAQERADLIAYLATLK
ncbi:MAG: c-type cytochrome [Polaromonas sp.]|nr:c-type cytochrome [Polaromonas sp.]